MFCSNCGKSLKAEHTSCPYCGMSVGESRFDSNRGYTGAQNKLRPGQAVRVPNSYGNHYSTKFTVDSDKRKKQLPSDEDVSYRAAQGASVTGYGEGDDREPLFDSDSDDSWSYGEPEEEQPEAEQEPPKQEKRSFRSLFLRREEEQPEQAEPEFDANESDDYELTEEEKNAITLSEAPSAPKSGISEDVRRFMSGLREEYDRKTREEERKAAKKKAKKRGAEPEEPKKSHEAYDAYDEYEAQADAPEEYEDFEPEDGTEQYEDGEDLEDIDETDETPINAAKATKEKKKAKSKAKPAARKQIRVAKEYFRRNKPDEDFEDFDPDEDVETADGEYDDDSVDEELRRSNRMKLLRMVLACSLALLLILGAVAFIRTLKKQNEQGAPVEDVTPSLWEEGTKLMQYRVSEEYISAKMKLYDSANKDSSWAVFSAAYSNDLADLDKLLPPSDTRMMNDQRFVETLKAVQNNINNCLANDFMAMMDTAKTEAQKKTESQGRWAVVRGQVNALCNAKSQGELDAVKKYDTVTFTQEKQKEEAEQQSKTEETYTSLQKGSKGDEVTRLQTRLVELGYLTGAVDGDYGNQTKTAVQLFQQAAGIKPTDGIASEETQRRLYADDAPRRQ